MKDDNVFIRGQHPDTRSNQEFMKMLNDKFPKRKPTRAKREFKKEWYPYMTKKGRKVMCLSNGKIYTSIREAAEDIRVDKSDLGKHLQGHPSRQTMRGHIFSYV